MVQCLDEVVSIVEYYCNYDVIGNVLLIVRGSRISQENKWLRGEEEKENLYSINIAISRNLVLKRKRKKDIVAPC